jgi:hypothetical protein
MPLIKRPPMPPKKDTIALRLEVTLIEELKRYRAFLGGDTSYVVTECLSRVFDKDSDYQKWLKEHSSLPLEAKRKRSGHAENGANAAGSAPLLEPRMPCTEEK